MPDVVNYRFRLRRGLAATWAATNDMLLDGEFGLETDTRKLKIGDGVTGWNDLDYFTTGTALGPANAGAGIVIDVGDPEMPIIGSTLGAVAVKGTVLDYSFLPAIGNAAGDAYFCRQDRQIYIWGDGIWPEKGHGFPSNAGADAIPSVVQFQTYVGNGPPTFTLPAAPTPGNVFVLLMGQYDYASVTYASNWSWTHYTSGADDYMHYACRVITSADSASISGILTSTASARGTSAILIELSGAAVPLNEVATVSTEASRSTLTQTAAMPSGPRLLLSMFHTTGSVLYPTTPANSTEISRISGISAFASPRASTFNKAKVTGIGSVLHSATWSSAVNSYGLMLLIPAASAVTVTPL